MNKLLKIYFFTFILITVTALQASMAQDKKLVYDYPIKPGSDTWKSFKSTAEKVKACQLPEAVLERASSDELLEVCLNYPMIRTYTASNSPYEGLMNLVSVFNGLSAFIKRPDSHLALFKYYKRENVNKIANLEKKGRYTFDFCAVELLLTNEMIFNRFNKAERLNVLNEIIGKYHEKEKYKEHFGFFGVMTTAFVANRFVETLEGKKSALNKNMDLFTSRMVVTDTKIVDQVLLNAFNYLKMNKK